MKLSVRDRFLWPTLLATVMGLGLVSLLSHFSLSEVFYRRTLQQIAQQCDGLSRQIADWCGDNLAKVQERAGRDVFRRIVTSGDPADAVRASEMLAETRQRYGYVRMAVLDREGVVRASSQPDEMGIGYSDRTYFRVAITGVTPKPEILQSRATGVPVVEFCAPMKSGSEIVGALVMSLSIERFTERFIQPARIGEKGYVYMLNQEGLTLAHPEKDRVFRDNVSKYDFGRRILERHDGLLTYDWQGRTVVAQLVTIPDIGWIVVARADKDDLMEPVRKVLNRDIVISVITLSFIGLVIWLAARHVTIPLVQAPISRRTSPMETSRPIFRSAAPMRSGN